MKLQPIIISILVLFITLFYIVWVWYEGKREAYYYYQKMKTDDFGKNMGEHEMFTIQRVVVHSIVLWSLGILLCNPILTVAVFLGIWSSFMLFHDGAYYLYRNKLDPTIYPRGFNDQSTSSTAWSDRWSNPLIRMLLGGIGLTAVFIICTIIVIK